MDSNFSSIIWHRTKLPAVKAEKVLYKSACADKLRGMNPLDAASQEWENKYQEEALRLISSGIPPDEAKRQARDLAGQWMRDADTRPEWDGDLGVYDPPRRNKDDCMDL